MSTNVGKEIAHIPVRCIEYHSIGSLFFILKRLQRLSSFDVTVPLENMRVPGGSDSRMQLEINIQSGADPGFLKGGGPGTDTRFFTSTPPLGHCPRDVIRPQKI